MELWQLAIGLMKANGCFAYTGSNENVGAAPLIDGGHVQIVAQIEVGEQKDLG